jgi:hypothetical protein
MKLLRFFALGSGVKSNSAAAACPCVAATGTGTGIGVLPNSTLPDPKRGIPSVFAEAGDATCAGTGGTAPGGIGGGAAFTGIDGAFGFQPGGIKPTPGSISGKLPIELTVAGLPAISLPVSVTFCSSAGAALHPKTVHPPFSAKQSEWCGVPQPGQSNSSPAPGSIADRQYGQTATLMSGAAPCIETRSARFAANRHPAGGASAPDFRQQTRGPWLSALHANRKCPPARAAQVCWDP